MRLIIVDDNSLDRAETRRLLLKGSERTFSFTEAASVTAAVSMIRDAPGGPPDLAIVDYHLPDGTALDLLTGLKGDDGNAVCPVVVMTGGDVLTLGRQVLRAGAQDFVGKSWMTVESLARAVDNAVERWAMSAELHASVSRLARAQRAANVGTWDWSLVANEATWTDEAWRLFGAARVPGPVSYDFWLRTVHPDDREAAAAHALEARRTGIYRCEYRVRHADGTVLMLESLGEGEFGPSGAPVRLLGTVRDVTARHQADQALKAALEQAKQAVVQRDHLVSLISHDLRAPLNNILLSTSLLEGHVADAALLIPGRITRQVTRMARMVDELLDVSQLRAGQRLALDLSEVEIIGMLRETAQNMQTMSPMHRIVIDAGVPSLVGRWDRARIERVVTNLLSNAVKYSPDGGPVSVTVEHDAAAQGSPTAVLRVSDEGIGIAASDRPRVFEWFSRGRNARRIGIAGIGIGLAGVKDIVEQHGGTIDIESNSPRGSIFTLRIPLHPPPLPLPPESDRTLCA
ncbi:MAG: multi-sensor signal transduction histidine kinase [Labilithrix sp.]|nr:multi-sensor signal transduction histidine kinase [Labilithrix sp.]